MQSFYKYLLIFCCTFLLFRCVDEITTPDNFESKVYIFGNITNETDFLTITVGRTVPLDSRNTILVNEAKIALFTKDGNDNTSLVTDDFNFSRTNESYTSAQQITPIIGNRYWIEVVVDNVIYRSSPELLKPPVPITNLEVVNNKIKVIFSDPEAEINHYLAEFDLYDAADNFLSTQEEISNDVFFDGNENAIIEKTVFIGSFERTEATLSQFDFATYQFYLNIINQKEANQDSGEGDSGRLFATPAVNIIGNILNTTTNSPVLGHFGVISKSTFSFEDNRTQIAYTGINLIDGVSDLSLSNKTIVLDKASGTIVDIFDLNAKELDRQQVEVINMEGKYMIPGLIDGHVHLASCTCDNVANGKETIEYLFRKGITTVRDLAGNGPALQTLKNMGANIRSPRSKIYFSSFVAGQYFLDNDSRVPDIAGSSTPGKEPWLVALDDNTDVEKLVRDAKDFGASGLKVYADISPVNAKRVIAAAREQGLAAWSHGSVFSASPWDVVESNSISHADLLTFVTTPTTPSTRELSEGYNVIYDASTTTSSSMLAYFDLLKSNNTILDATLVAHTFGEADLPEGFVEFTNEVTKEAYRNGVKIGAGTDQFNSNFVGRSDLLNELQLLIDKAGMTTMDAIKAATIHNAIATGIDAEYGTIEIGKKADLVILDANPLTQIENIEAVNTVLKEGVKFIIN